jgi:ATP-binding cassette subfamily B protein
MAREGHYYRLYQAQARNVDTETNEERRIAPMEKTHVEV